MIPNDRLIGRAIIGAGLPEGRSETVGGTKRQRRKAEQAEREWERDREWRALLAIAQAELDAETPEPS